MSLLNDWFEISASEIKLMAVSLEPGCHLLSLSDFVKNRKVSSSDL